jgi:hypothetical protein
VESAIARRAAAAQPTAQPQRFSAARATFLATDIRADRLLRVIADIAEGAPDFQPAPIHFVILAAARALAELDVAPVIGLQRDGSATHIVDPDACRSLSTIVAANHVDIGTPDAAMILLVADHSDATVIACVPSLNCGATLGVGAINRVFRPDAAGEPVPRAELHLTFGLRDDAALPGGSGLLERIRVLLENPFVLLAM